MIRCRQLIVAAIILASDLACAGADSDPSVDLAPGTPQLPKRAAQYAGETFTLAPEAATGQAPLAYQWKRDGGNIPGATSATLHFPDLSPTDAGFYQVAVSNSDGITTSSGCDLAVIPAPDLENAPPLTGERTRYYAQGGAVIGVNQGRFFNRPHYSNNTNAFILTGDRPMVKFASGGTIHGCFLVGVQRGAQTKWVHDFEKVAAAFQPAHTTWLATDPAFPGLRLRLQALTLGGGATGFAVRATAEGASGEDQLVWAYGGASRANGRLNWDLDPYPVGEETLLKASFDPASARANNAQVNEGVLAGSFTLAPQGADALTFGRVTSGSVALADATDWRTPAILLASKVKEHPLIIGLISMSQTPAAHWSFTRQPKFIASLDHGTDPKILFTEGLQRSADFASRLILDTPDPRVNAAATMAVAGVDGMWYGNKFVHGSMSWNSPYLGWRTTIGGTMLGWHDRVKASVDHYLATQVAESEKTSGEAMGVHQGRDYLLTKPGPDSRFYGRGYIRGDQDFYEMQTQYFDQVLQDWRWRLSAEPLYEAKLRRGLELHLERLKECYDPDSNGTYESVINTWPTDCVWFNGGGCPDATAYAYRAHEFARDLAQRAGDNPSAKRHQAELAKIKAAFFKDLWIPASGHPGLFREQGGHRRLVDNPWLYSLCIPIEAGLLTLEEAATTLHNAEYNLENIQMASGGRRVVTSNFTPAIWSVRVLWPGDNYMLAHAYFRTGLARDGWDVLRGSILHTGFNDLVPGDSVDLIGGTDFGDTVHTFTRALVEGLFGYQPNYPFGKVLVAPQFPADWNKAAMKTPATSIRFDRSGTTSTLSVCLQRKASLDVDLPVRSTAITQVTVDGAPAVYQTRAGFGHTVVRVTSPATGQAVRIAVTTADPLPEVMPVAVKGMAGDKVRLELPDAASASVMSFTDPLGALQNAALSDNAVSGTLSTNTGHRRVFARVKTGSLEQLRIFNLHILPATSTLTTLAAAPAGTVWKTVDLSAHLAADITQIYEQKYLSPRPQTVSTRIGTDGYSPWCFPHWGASRPKITTDKVAALLDRTEPARLVTPQGVPFLWGGPTNNVAFAALWDNWPDKVSAPVQQRGEAVWFLICGSTTVMQTRIANAVLRLHYADGVEETLELIPPYNYWNLSPIRGIQARAQFGSAYYTEDTEAFTVPKPWPLTVELGSNCRAMVLSRKLRPGVTVNAVTLEALSQECVVGLMGLTIMNPE
jgi:hypothetical protein